ncbi:MAG TPA: alkaline phosphatase family protein [Anaerolineales bacterium]|nr:alkaline phosphatase family protein [Anaerolineales bacterium]
MKTLILGFDSFDPAVFEDMAGRHQLPNLEKFSQHGGYARLEVCSPPQTEVSWTSIATGSDPGGHGIFDFVHRDPSSYTPYVSILPTRKSAVGEQFVPPYTAKTFFEAAADLGYPATALWWPAMFPARPALPVNTLPGLGTPDIRGQLGVGTLLTTEERTLEKTAVAKVSPDGRNRYKGILSGPQTRGRDGPQTITLPLQLEIIDERSARLRIDGQQIDLPLGKWSDIVELRFKLGILTNVHAITRFIATCLRDDIRVYALPLQIHPLHSVWHYASSPSFARKLWKDVGPYLTLGWPQDTTGLEDGCITDDQFLDLCQSIFHRRIQILYYLLNDFREGVLAAIFDDLDRVQHMFFRDRMDVVQDWYRRLDGFVGEVSDRIEAWTGTYRYLILSDHGFANFHTKIHLNRWLLDQGYLITKNDGGDLNGVDWSQTRAYAVGLNSLYLNIAGREAQGILAPDAVEPLLSELRAKLMGWTDTRNTRVIQNVRLKHETYSGPYTRFGPDLVVGYAPGYRASAETGLGKIPAIVLEPNSDHWGADHCMDADAVPGVIFANRDLRDFGTLSFRDIPFLAIGKHLEGTNIKPPSQAAGQGQKDLEERLKGLGYL